MSDRDWNNLFKPEDFERFWNEARTAGYSNAHLAKLCAEIANAKLKEALEQAPVVTGTIHPEFGAVNFDEHGARDATHSAKLVAIRRTE
jgi:hypothetical protein